MTISYSVKIAPSALLVIALLFAGCSGPARTAAARATFCHGIAMKKAPNRMSPGEVNRQANNEDEQDSVDLAIQMKIPLSEAHVLLSQAATDFEAGKFTCPQKGPKRRPWW
jgi:hypothetical protein